MSLPIKILILKLGAIGDVVMASSLITAIDEKYPNAEITWICGRTVEPILSGIKRINTIITVDEDKFYCGSLLDKIKTIFGVWKYIAGKHFQIVLNCYRDKRYKIFLLPVRSTIYKDIGNRNRENSFLSGRYHSDEYSRMITGNDNWQLKSSKFPKISLPHNQRIKDLLEGTTSPKIILAPGGTKNILRQDDLRRWPIENYVLLAKELDDRKITVILVGAETDKWVLTEIAGINFVNLIGKTGLLGLIQLFNNSDILVTHDTGVFHLAKLSKIKIIALFGPVNPKERIGNNENVEVLWGGSKLPCSPCYNEKIFADCSNNICMKNISVADVTDKIESILNSKL